MEPIINDKIKNYFSYNKSIIVYSVIIAIICYGYELFNFTLSIDEEVLSFERAKDLTMLISQGRWGTYLINLFFVRSSIIPFFPTLISILCIAAAGFLYINNETDDLTSKIVFCTIFISYPLHSYYLAFNTLCISLGFGLVLSVLSFIFLKQALFSKVINYKKIIFSVVLLVFSTSIYQGTISIFIILSVAHFFLNSLKDESILKKRVLIKISQFIAVFIIALIVYKLADLSIKNIFSSFLYEENYLDNFSGWGKAPVKTILYSLFGNTVYYLTDRRFYGGYSILSIYLIIPLILFVICKKVKGLNNKLFSVLLLFILIISPFFLMYAIGSCLAPRSILALPFMIAIIWYILFVNVKVRFKKLLLFATMIIFLGNTYCTTRLFYSTYTNWQADRDMANRIIERIYSLDLPENNKQIPIAFIGKYHHPENELFLKTIDDVFGASFFEWDDGNPHRMNLIFKTIGENSFLVIFPDSNNQLIEKSKDMPCWPFKGSVKLSENVVIVKLSEE